MLFLFQTVFLFMWGFTFYETNFSKGTNITDSPHSSDKIARYDEILKNSELTFVNQMVTSTKEIHPH